MLEFDAASNTQVDKIRELIIDNVKYAPTRGRYKVYIVDEVHMLSTSSFNALLKTLEEPPAHVKFVFATTDVQKVPTTILSRCQRFDLKRIPTALIAEHLLDIAEQGEDRADAGRRRRRSRAERRAGCAMRSRCSISSSLSAATRSTRATCFRSSASPRTQTVFALCASTHLRRRAERARDASTSRRRRAGICTRLMSDLIAHLRNLLVAQADPGGLAERAERGGGRAR